MEIYLKHPVHGTKVATMEQEAKYDESLGWTRFERNVEEKKKESKAEKAAREALENLGIAQ